MRRRNGSRRGALRAPSAVRGRFRAHAMRPYGGRFERPTPRLRDAVTSLEMTYAQKRAVASKVSAAWVCGR
jgi:hypothetical protein